MFYAATPSYDDALQKAVDVIVDLDDLVRLLLVRLPRIKPWQRSLADQLSNAEREVQILRMTISLERAANELTDAAMSLRRTVRAIEAGLRATRADAGTRQAVLLLVALSDSIARMMNGLAATHPGDANSEGART